jgi:hypothetical protein
MLKPQSPVSGAIENASKALPTVGNDTHSPVRGQVARSLNRRPTRLHGRWLFQLVKLFGEQGQELFLSGNDVA